MWRGKHIHVCIRCANIITTKLLGDACYMSGKSCFSWSFRACTMRHVRFAEAMTRATLPRHYRRHVITSSTNTASTRGDLYRLSNAPHSEWIHLLRMHRCDALHEIWVCIDVGYSASDVDRKHLLSHAGLTIMLLLGLTKTYDWWIHNKSCLDNNRSTQRVIQVTTHISLQLSMVFYKAQFCSRPTGRYTYYLSYVIIHKI